MKMEVYVNGELADANDEFTWEGIRQMRNALLEITDKYMVSDWLSTRTEAEQQALIDYRQALRDLPSTTDDMNDLEFPVEPDWVEI